MPQTDEDAQERWYCDQQGEQHGPVSFGALLNLTEQHAIGEDTLVWQAGTPAWRPLSVVLRSRTRPTWTISTVVTVGLILIGAATVEAIIRDVVYLNMLESKQKSQLREMQE